MVTLKNITEDNFRECTKLDVEESQKTFVAPNTYSLAQAWLYSDNARPFAVYSDDMMIGFAMLDIDYYGDGSKRACGLWRFMIDKNYQNRGYGKAAMLEIVKYVKNELNPETFRTSVVPGNDAAERLYQSLGFVKNGEFEDNEAVMVLELRTV